MKKAKTSPNLWLFLLFAAAYVYFEVLFRVSSLGMLFSGSTVYMLLFALCWGLLGYLIATVIPNRKVSIVLTALQLLLTGVIFLVEYFTHRYFKVFYDVTTVIGGAGGVATDFMDVILELIFSWDGLLKITLFLLPGLLYVFWLRRFAYCHKLGLLKRLIALILTLAVFGGNTALLLGDSTYAPMYQEEYNFQGAVSNFGLLTGIRLDVQELLFGKDMSADFETVEIPTVPATTQEETTPTSPEATSDPTTVVTETTEATEATQATESTEATEATETTEATEARTLLYSITVRLILPKVR